jgi:hypothetical protein
MPSLTRSSSAIRPSPQVRFAATIVAINCCKSMEIGGRPGARDFQRHHNRNNLPELGRHPLCADHRSSDTLDPIRAIWETTAAGR